MTRLAACVATALIATSCARPVPEPPRQPARDLVALAPDPETGDVGRLTVSTPAGKVELIERNASTTVTNGAAPTSPTVMSDADVQAVFGAALAVQAPAALRFLLYFEPDVMGAVRRRVAPDVSVIGHTDTTGTADSNAALGLQRATLIRDQLLQAGLDAELIEVVSHGESDPLVPTADSIAEAKNRRVEVIVR